MCCRRTPATVIARSAQRDEAISVTDWAAAIWRNEPEKGAAHVLAKRTRERLAAVEQQIRVAGQYPLAIHTERANLIDEFLHARGVPDLLRIIRAEDAARRRQLNQRRLN